MSVLEAVFWIGVALLAYAQVGYPLLLIAAARLVRAPAPSAAARPPGPR